VIDADVVVTEAVAVVVVGLVRVVAGGTTTIELTLEDGRPGTPTRTGGLKKVVLTRAPTRGGLGLERGVQV
jgi:hypothetical protein